MSWQCETTAAAGVGGMRNSINLQCTLPNHSCTLLPDHYAPSVMRTSFATVSGASDFRYAGSESCLYTLGQVPPDFE